MPDFRIDRILDDTEIDQLNDLLVPELEKEYPNFGIWLEKAQVDIKNGSRIAIGIWREKLIATSIIKLTASNTAELKSFFVDPNFRDQGYGLGLFKETEAQCRKAGITKIMTDTFIDNFSMVGFFLSKGFIFSGREDIYGIGKESYRLSKNLRPKYIGDPFDWENIGEWFLKSKINAISISNHPTVNSRTFDRHMKLVSGDNEFNILVEIKDQYVDLDPVQILHTTCTNSDFQIPIFVGRKFSPRAIEYAEKNGVLIFDASDIGELMGEMPKKFREGPTVGMTVSIKPSYLTRLIEGSKPCYYVKGGPIGKTLQDCDTIIFYSTAPEKKIRAIGIVGRIELGTPLDIWKKIKAETIFSEEEYFRFASIKKSILAVYLKEIQEINVIEGENLDRMVPPKDRHGSYIDKVKLDEILS